MPRARSILLAVGLGTAAPLTAVPATAASTDAASSNAANYDEALRCAAIDSIVLGAMRPADETAASPADRASAKALEDRAVSWLMLAVNLNSADEAATKVDFGAAINALSDAIAQAPDSAALEQIISPGLQHCVQRESELFG